MSGMFYPTDDFNPRSREGSDLYKQWNERVQQISIHAPAKGATQVGFLKSFYSVSFQSTLPRRERPFGIYHRVTGFYNFNPRSREGSDDI